MSGRARPPRRQPPAAPRYLRGGPAPAGSENWVRPWVQLRTYSFGSTLYPAMLGVASRDAKPGDLVAVYDKEGRHFGTGLFNPNARVPLRVLRHGAEPVGEDWLQATLARAVDWRRLALRLDEQADAWRVVNSDGDNLSGLIVDRYADVLSVEVHSLGMHRRLAGWVPWLHQQLGTRRAVVRGEERSAERTGFDSPARCHSELVEGAESARRRCSSRQSPQFGSAPEIRPGSLGKLGMTTARQDEDAVVSWGVSTGQNALFPDTVRTVRIREHGVRFEVNFGSGHKTGFFCDQRDNRHRFAGLVQGRRLLDLCCYTGGFAVSAAVHGGATDVTGVDLDEEALAQARRNGNLNQQSRLRWVHADAFAWARQMHLNGERWGAIVLDPPKLLESREEEALGRRKYEDLNSLAVQLVEPGGLFVTCSCSGLLSLEDFEQIVIRSAHRLSRRLQIFDRTGPGPDHPVMSNCLEGRYLKVLWARVW